MVYAQRTGSSAEKRRYIRMVGGKASDRTNHTKRQKTVMGEGEEGKRTDGRQI